MKKMRRHLWNTLEKLYASKTGVLNQLSSVGVTFEDEILGLWLLNTLPDFWETFRVSHTNSAPGEKMSFDYAKNVILNEEIRRKTQGTSSQNEVLFTKQRGRNPNRGKGNRGKSRSKSRSSKYKDVEYHYCHKPGHIKKNCWSLKNKKNGNNKNAEKSEEDSTDRVTAATSDDLIIVSDDHDINLVSSDICWVGDSGAAVHVTPRREFFSTYTVGEFSPLRMGNNGLAKVASIGNIHLKVKNGSTVLLRDVRHAPDVRLNLISIGRPDSDGYGNNFVDRKFKISKGFMILTKGWKLKENLYMLEASVSDDSVNVVGKQCSPELWHKRLSHIIAKGLETLVKKNVLQESSDSHSHDDLVDIDPSSIPHLPTTVGGDAVEAEMQLDDFADYQQDENLENPPYIDDNDPQDVEPRRSTRERQQAARYSSSEYVLLTDGGEPKYFEEAMEGVGKQNWFLAMKDEMESFHDNDTFDLMPLPKDVSLKLVVLLPEWQDPPHSC
ncbi:hypothetical protein SASPL_108931 [Salvia splendens]|uniref:GAG-pre-integrase domain-containing protein n=1 Tax=Salvia splendens TaxID=180675 RepID=A0A8X9A735_SALSN|nr:hypothetical protein SASPL_108931 [Salvia splendens]